MPLAPENISMDVVNTLIYIIAIWRIAEAFHKNHLTVKQRIILGGFAVLGAIMVFQTSVTVLTGSIAFIPVWDFYNFIHVMLALSIVTLIKDRKELA